jgi:signal transduction histidine kinase
MNQFRWFYHPVFVFIFSIMALGLSLFLYIYWYMEVSTGFRAVVERFNLDTNQVLESQTWIVILVLSILVAIILIGIFTIFVYAQKTIQLYRLQNNFISNFTHELKTPVTSLKLYLETFLKYDLPREERCKYLRYMIRDAERLSDNINRILNLSRIESDSYSGEFALTDVYELIRSSLEKTAHLFQNCSITLHPFSQHPVFYPTNPMLFEMLLNNLLSNAVKYNRSENPRIDIRFDIVKRHLHIRFEDNGIGIEKSETRKIFRKFYQVGKSDDMTAKGSGLGLYLVQSIAKIHKGKITAESRGLGKGSTFILILPYNADLCHDQT